MPRRSQRARETRQFERSDGLRARDKRGNVRPADDRFLTTEQKAKRDEYVARVHAEDGEPSPVGVPTETVDDLVRRLNDERGVPTRGGSSETEEEK